MTAEPSRHEDRHRAREAALQMLYQWEITHGDLGDVERSYWTLRVVPETDERRAFGAVLLEGTVGHLDAIDPLIAGSTDNWRFERLAVMDRLIMRLAVFELLYQPDTPPRVVINEALELAKTFSSDESVPFINGVLDNIKRQVETGERTGAVTDRPHHP